VASAVALFLAVNLVVTWGLYLLVLRVEAAPFLPGALRAVAQDHPALWWLIAWLAVNLFGLCLLLRRALIGAIRLYQRYAPEDVRRRCLFKPTCSEYGILAMEKYGVVIGLIKLYDRLVLRCRGNIYRIDDP
jgi:putative component of membrane protein insertase Oxa1/YidC/SpoIIIJ protein YidD